MVVAAVIRQWVEESSIHPTGPKLANSLQKRPEWRQALAMVRMANEWLTHPDAPQQCLVEKSDENVVWYNYLHFLEDRAGQEPEVTSRHSEFHHAEMLHYSHKPEGAGDAPAQPSGYVPVRSHLTNIKYEAGHILAKLNLPATPSTVDFLLSQVRDSGDPKNQSFPARGGLVTTFCFHSVAHVVDTDGYYIFEEDAVSYSAGDALSTFASAGGQMPQKLYAEAGAVQNSHRDWWKAVSGSEESELDLTAYNKGNRAEDPKEEREIEQVLSGNLAFTELWENCCDRKLERIAAAQSDANGMRLSSLGEADRRREKDRLKKNIAKRRAQRGKP